MTRAIVGIAYLAGLYLLVNAETVTPAMLALVLFPGLPLVAWLLAPLFVRGKVRR